MITTCCANSPLLNTSSGVIIIESWEDYVLLWVLHLTISRMAQIGRHAAGNRQVSSSNPDLGNFICNSYFIIGVLNMRANNYSRESSTFLHFIYFQSFLPKLNNNFPVHL